MVAQGRRWTRMLLGQRNQDLARRAVADIEHGLQTLIETPTDNCSGFIKNTCRRGTDHSTTRPGTGPAFGIAPRSR